MNKCGSHESIHNIRAKINIKKQKTISDIRFSVERQFALCSVTASRPSVSSVQISVSTVNCILPGSSPCSVSSFRISPAAAFAETIRVEMYTGGDTNPALLLQKNGMR